MSQPPAPPPVPGPPSPHDDTIQMAPAPHPFDRVRMRGLVAWTVLGVVVAGGVAALTGGLATVSDVSSGQDADAVPLAQPVLLLFMAVIYLWALLWAWRQDRRLGIRLGRFFRGPLPRLLPLAGLVVLILLFSFGSFWFVHRLLQALAPGLAEQMLEGPELLVLPMTSAADVLVNLSFFLVVAVLAPVVEELLFRGFLVNRWGRRWGLTTGILLSSAVFAVLHAHWVGLFVFGLVMALLYVATGSLWAPILAHVLNNATAFLLALVGAADLHLVDPGTVERIGASPWTAALMLALAGPLLLRWAGEHWPHADAPLPWDAAAPHEDVSDVPRNLPGGAAPDMPLQLPEQDHV